MVNPQRLTKVKYRAPFSEHWEERPLDWAMERIAHLVKQTRDETLVHQLPNGTTVNHTMAMAELGGATLDNEENYLIKKLCGGGIGMAAVGDEAFGGWDRVDVDRVLALQAAVERTRHIPQLAGGLDRVRAEAGKHRIALMCAEREPLECHRTILVSRELASTGTPVAHIHADGRLEPHAGAMRRLLELLGLPEQDLFRSQSELIDGACRKQEERIAYVNKQFPHKTEKPQT